MEKTELIKEFDSFQLSNLVCLLQDGETSFPLIYSKELKPILMAFLSHNIALKEFNHECATNCPLGKRYVEIRPNFVTGAVYFTLLEEGEELA
jgi:hypothetical protein